jgi:hypothetical protein
VGIAPDLVVLPTAIEIKSGIDPELERALEALQSPE